MAIDILVPVERLIAKLESDELIRLLGSDLANQLSNAAPVASGATKKALSYIGEPERTASGWRIGVGNAVDTGQPNEPMETGTLRAFFEYLASTGLKPRPTNWWSMSKQNKDLLEQARRGGMFGGRGMSDAHYLWVQNRRTSFADNAVERFRQNSHTIISDYLKNK